MSNGTTVSLKKNKSQVVLSNRRFRFVFETAEKVAKPRVEIWISTLGDGKYDINTGLHPWSGFSGITSHIHDFFITTDEPQAPGIEVLEETPQRCAIRYGLLHAAGWEIFWDIGFDEETVTIDAFARVTRNTITDAEVDVLVFDVPPADEFNTAFFNTGYILPPKDWFRRDEPEITYIGNDGGRSPLDRRARLRFSGTDHQTLTLFFNKGYGLNMTNPGNNYFLIVPKFIGCERPHDRKRLPIRPYQFRSHERFGIGTTQNNEARTYKAGEVLTGQVILSYEKPRRIETLDFRAPDSRVARLTRQFQKTHGHSSVGHDSGFAGGWHNAGTERSWSVSFEYFMHSKMHLYSNHEAIDGVMDRALDAVFRYETRPDGLAWRHGFEGRGAFLEANAAMLLFLGDYARRTGDLKHLDKGRVWARWLLAQFSKRPFLYQAPNSTGIPGGGRGGKICNWWDVVRFGGYDAYANVLIYPAFLDLAAMEEAAGHPRQAEKFRKEASKLKDDFNRVFWLPKEKRYAAWVDTEDTVHDYCFTPVNLMAVYYGLCDRKRGEVILKGIDAKLKEIGYKGFSLPCNLIPFPPDIYDAGDYWYEHHGYGHFYDPFGIYENGGIWTWLSAYYCAAWAQYDPEHAYKHFVKILDQYERDNIQGMGNGYFWDPQTGEMQEGSKQEPYLANAGMSVWGFLSLLGIEMEIGGGIRLRPCLPKSLRNAELGFRYHGKQVLFRMQGWGSQMKGLTLDGVSYPANRPIRPDRLKEGSVVAVRLSHP